MKKKIHNSSVKEGAALCGVVTRTRRPLTLVPYHLARHCLHAHRSGLLAVYLAMRTETGISTPDIQAIAKRVGCHPKTVSHRIEKMIQYQWIVPQSGNTFRLKSIRELEAIYSCRRSRAHLEVGDLSLTRTCLMLGVIALLNAILPGVPSSPSQREARSGGHSGGLAASILAKCADLTRAWAFKVLGQLEAQGQIERVRRHRKVDDLFPDELDHLRTHDPEAVMFLRKGWGSVYEHLASIITPRDFQRLHFVKD